MLIGLSVCDNILFVDEVFLGSISLYNNRIFSEGIFYIIITVVVFECSSGLA